MIITVPGGSDLQSNITGSQEVKNVIEEIGNAFAGRGVGVVIWALQAALEREK